jgi:hypothetical protein
MPAIRALTPIPHASRYCDGDKNVATLAGKRPHLSVNGKAEP